MFGRGLTCKDARNQKSKIAFVTSFYNDPRAAKRKLCRYSPYILRSLRLSLVNRIMGSVRESLIKSEKRVLPLN